jgi:hypothetical protein
MRILNIVSGVSVLFTTLAYGHLLHHYFAYATHDAYRNPRFWAAILAAGGAGTLSFIGGFLLLKRIR